MSDNKGHPQKNHSQSTKPQVASKDDDESPIKEDVPVAETEPLTPSPEDVAWQPIGTASTATTPAATTFAGTAPGEEDGLF